LPAKRTTFNAHWPTNLINNAKSKKTKTWLPAKRTTFNAHSPTNLINNVEAEEKKGMRRQLKKTNMRAEATVTIHSCISLNEQENHDMI